jgi:hypothetical protein
MMRRILVASLVLVVSIMGLSPPAGGVAGFGDVEAGRFYASAVQWMVEGDITTGTSPTCFSPDDLVTRGQAAAFIWRMEGRPLGSPPHGFTDVAAEWQQDPVSWMKATGITTGTSPATYSPDRSLTRGELAALLHRLAGSPAEGPSGFPDVVKGWQIVPVGWMLANGITTGTSPTTFSPDEFVTRGQLAAFFYRYKGSPTVTIDPDSPICPDFAGPIQPQPNFTGSVGFQLSSAGNGITGFLVTLDMNDYRCPGTSTTLSMSGTSQVFPTDLVTVVGGSFEFSSSSQDWTGTISGDSASGTVAGEIMLGFPDPFAPFPISETCEWGPVNWTATRT